MTNRFCSHGGRNPTTIEKGVVEPQEFSHLPGDEIERLIALCEAPALLWTDKAAPAREPEPFGMIA